MTWHPIRPMPDIKKDQQIGKSSRERQDILVRFQYTIEQSPEAVFWLERNGRFSYVNLQACRSLGYSREELLSMYLWDIDPDFPKRRWKKHWEELRTLGRRTFETRHRRKDGYIFPIEVSACQVTLGDQEFHAAFVRDITESKKAREEQSRLQEQLQQAQKLEAIGTLAGGVAHDFNNMLSVILGYSEMLRNKLPAGHGVLRDIGEIEKAARRSMDITRQLLAFSRKQVIAPVALDMNRQIGSTVKMLGRLIGENMELDFGPGEELWMVKLDPSQLDQILINLAVNARDAMPQGGKLTIKTSNMTPAGKSLPFNGDVSPGPYVRLTVSDNGSGMDKEVLSRVFEPFFTTKETGKGTGLGLSTIYGIIKQNNGFIDVRSEPGTGTTFNIYFPRFEGKEQIPEMTEPTPGSQGSSTILLVEDDDMVRNMTANMIETLGHTVLAVPGPLAALSFCETTHVPIDLLLTDTIMPKMDGAELSSRIEVLRPGIKVLFMSGYPTAPRGGGKALPYRGNFIEKPFTKDHLASKIRKILHE